PLPRSLKLLVSCADTSTPPPRPLWGRAIAYGGDFGTDSTVWLGRFPMPAMYASESQYVRDFCRRSVALATALAAADPQSLPARKALADAYGNVSVVHHSHWYGRGTEISRRKALELRKGISVLEPRGPPRPSQPRH